MIADNDPEEQEKIVRFSTLLTNAVIFHTTLDMMMVLRELIAVGLTPGLPVVRGTMPKDALDLRR